MTQTQQTPAPNRLWWLLGSLAVIVVTAVVVAASLLRGGSGGSPGSSQGPPSSPPPSPTASAQPGVSNMHTSLSNGVTMDYDQATLTLGVLPVTKPASLTGFQAKAFPHWLDASTWGWPVEPNDACDAREAALLRDGTGTAFDPKTCAVTAGSWVDPYTGKDMAGPDKTEVDFVIPLAEAWRSGGSTWNEKQRSIYANAPLSLVTTSAESVQAKGDKGPEDWKPSDQSTWCAYAIRWISVKNTYGLNLTGEPERDALTAMLATCQRGEQI